MNVLMLNGSQVHDASAAIVHEVAAARLERAGWRVSSLLPAEMKIAPCTGCFGCWVRTPGTCVIDDEGRDVARALVLSDLVLLITPVRFGGYSSALKKALDRIICVVSPSFMKIGGEVHHGPRYERYPSLVAVGILDRHDDDGTRVFKTLVRRNAINIHSPSHAAGVLAAGSSDGDIAALLDRLFQEAGVAV